MSFFQVSWQGQSMGFLILSSLGDLSSLPFLHFSSNGAPLWKEIGPLCPVVGTRQDHMVEETSNLLSFPLEIRPNLQQEVLPLSLIMTKYSCSLSLMFLICKVEIVETAGIHTRGRIFNKFSEGLARDTVCGSDKLSKAHPCPQESSQGLLLGLF